MDAREIEGNLAALRSLLDRGLVTPDAAHVLADAYLAKRQLRAALLAAGLSPQALDPILADAERMERDNIREVETLRAQQLSDKANALRRRAGKSSGATRAAKAKAALAWMEPFFEEAYRQLDADCPARIGAANLSVRAMRVAGPTNTQRHLLNTYRAKQFLDTRRLRQKNKLRT